MRGVAWLTHWVWVSSCLQLRSSYIMRGVAWLTHWGWVSSCLQLRSSYIMRGVAWLTHWGWVSSCLQLRSSYIMRGVAWLTHWGWVSSCLQLRSSWPAHRAGLLWLNFFGQSGSVSKFPPFLCVKLWVGWVGRGYIEISRYFPTLWINRVTLVTKIKLWYSLGY